MKDRKITVKDMMRVLFKKEFYLDMAVFIFICIPATLAVLYFSIKLDKVLGLHFFIKNPYSAIFFIIFFTAGALIIWRAYSYLVIIGEGGPCPQLGGTKKLVTIGPYAWVRHPSVIGKLFGVIGLGCLSRSPVFTFIVIPALFIWSAFYNRFMQEKGCEEKFGEEYLEYRKNVPMFIPRFKGSRSKIAVPVVLFIIISGYLINNFIWTAKSPVYFYRDSAANIQWAVYYGKLLRNESLVYQPALFHLLKNKDIEISNRIYYQEYSDVFQGPLSVKEKIDVRDLLRFHHPPLWFAFMGSLFAIFGFKLWVIYLAQTAFGALTIWLTYTLGKKTCFSSAGLVSAFILSTLPGFLIITRQGFLEAMMCPVALIGIIFAYRLLEAPSARFNYIIFGFICGIGMLVKSIFLIPAVLLLFIIFIFSDRKKTDTRGLFINCSFSFMIMILMVLPWFAYTKGASLGYFMAGIHKGRGQFLFDVRNILSIVPVIKNAQLGNFYFFLFIAAIASFCADSKLKKMAYLIFFIISGYFVTTLMPFPLIVRHLVYFIPAIVVFICCGIIKIPFLKYYITAAMVIFSFICGYGWLIPGLSRTDTMRYLYDDIGTNKLRNEKYSMYAADIRSCKYLSSFSPLPRMEQKAVYEKIKTITSLPGLKFVRIINPDRYFLEKNTLIGALALYSVMDSFPLLVENAAREKDVSCKGRIWIFIRGIDDSVDLSCAGVAEKNLTSEGTVFLSPDVMCDIFKEGENEINME